MNSYKEHLLRYQFPAVVWALLIFILSSIPASKLPKISIVGFDKIVHGSLFFILGVLVHRALEPRVQTDRFDWRRVIISVGVVIIYGASDELHQAWVPGRRVDILDLTADSVGGILSAIFVYFDEIRRRRKLSSSSS